MDRINKFLAKRPIKHKKVLHYKDKTYEITKEDLKKVRTYRSSRCLDPTFKLARPLDLSFTSVPSSEPLRPRKTKERSEETRKAILERLSRPRKIRVRKEKNVICDAWQDETLDDLRTYKQEWVYSIKSSYEGASVEKCSFSEDDLRAELRSVFLHYFRPRDVKEKKIEDILPKLSETSDMRPFPEEAGNRWAISGAVACFGTRVCSLARNRQRVVLYDLACGKVLREADFMQSIKKVCFDEESEELVIMTSHKIYSVGRDNKIVERFNSEAQLKDIALSSTRLCVLVANTVNVYDYKTSECLESRTIKHRRPHSLRFVGGGDLLVATASGIVSHLDTENAGNSSINYVIDFDEWRDHILAINNLNRLLVLSKDLQIKRNVVQPSMGRRVSGHRVLNMFAVMFEDEIGIYKLFDGEYVPVNVLKGAYRVMEWHPEMPWLFAATGTEIVMFT